VLPTFGGTPLYDDFAGIAAFPFPSPQTPHEYLISRHYLVDGKEGTMFATGRLTPSDVMLLEQSAATPGLK
jgi:hypothetical protein